MHERRHHMLGVELHGLGVVLLAPAIRLTGWDVTSTPFSGPMRRILWERVEKAKR